MNMIRLQNATKVGLVRCARPQFPDRGFLVPEGLQKRERKLSRIERLIGKCRDSFFDLNGIHVFAPQRLCARL
jgi:hypothetical protein